MVPLTLRIVKYTPCLVPGYADRPTIHVQGWMGGEMWEGGMDQRKIEGTVSVIADGSIRWKMVCVFCPSINGVVMFRCARSCQARKTLSNGSGVPKESKLAAGTALALAVAYSDSGLAGGTKRRIPLVSVHAVSSPNASDDVFQVRGGNGESRDYFVYRTTANPLHALFGSYLGIKIRIEVL